MSRWAPELVRECIYSEPLPFKTEEAVWSGEISFALKQRVDGHFESVGKFVAYRVGAYRTKLRR